MALFIRKIVYTGCVLAGKLRSLVSVLERTRHIPPPLESSLRDGVHRYVLTRAESPIVELLVAVSDRRATKIDYDPTSPDCDVRVAREIHYTSESDGIIFVLDSRRGRESANLGAFSRLDRDLRTVGMNLDDLPVVFQVNKRDAGDVVPMEWVRENFQTRRCAYVESIATKHVGTLEAMRGVLRLTGALECGDPGDP
ncbi:MAG: hypothetical protein U0270_32295 [Labilithrix sp.]